MLQMSIRPQPLTQRALANAYATVNPQSHERHCDLHAVSRLPSFNSFCKINSSAAFK
jgi:hypothetical protein